jgi:hypothetical protein
MNVDALIKLSQEVQDISKQAKDKLDLILINKEISDEDKNKVKQAQEIFSELQVAIENKDINKMNKLLEDVSKINI